LNRAVAHVKPPRVIDENAFGALVSYVTIEDDEYGLEDIATFQSRAEDFRRLCTEALASGAPPNAHAVFMGHALYVEVPETEEKPKLVGFVRSLREQLKERDVFTAAIVTFGGRWVMREDAVDVEVVTGTNYRLVTMSLPSEPLRKALHVEAACHAATDGEGWGPGLYLDSEALEPLGLNLKNQPTPLHIGDATYFRVGR
jgi:hypothetical protein